MSEDSRRGTARRVLVSATPRPGNAQRQNAAPELRRVIDIPAQWGGQRWPNPLAVDSAANFISAMLGSLKGRVSVASTWVHFGDDTGPELALPIFRRLTIAQSRAQGVTASAGLGWQGV